MPSLITLHGVIWDSPKIFNGPRFQREIGRRILRYPMLVGATVAEAIAVVAADGGVLDVDFAAVGIDAVGAVVLDLHAAVFLA